MGKFSPRKSGDKQNVHGVGKGNTILLQKPAGFTDPNKKLLCAQPGVKPRTDFSRSCWASTCGGCQGEIFLGHCWRSTGHYVPKQMDAENTVIRTRHTVVKLHAEYKEVSLCPFQPPGEGSPLITAWMRCECFSLQQCRPGFCCSSCLHWHRVRAVSRGGGAAEKQMLTIAIK